MAKKSKHKTQTNREAYEDKPDYAMDRMIQKKQEPVVTKPKEEQFLLEDSIPSYAMMKLTKLKEQLSTEETAKLPKQPAKPEKKKQRSAAERLEDNPDLSFAELFDPADEEDASFDELLNASKLDWKYFKDDN